MADLHIHSKYSRATSQECDLDNLAFWAQKKGVTVVGTGDFTHPAWRQELTQHLLPAEPGLWRLDPATTGARHTAAQLPLACRSEVRFLLTAEIANVYKHAGVTRKVHNLVFMPSFAAVERFVARLARVGNLLADGRPILGLDARDLLEITLEADPDAFLVPAHIWTPWFSVLGSKSGFDSIEACFRDLADHIFALETGLSSDPAMNWRLSQLDRYRLISNSDAHSPAKLAREANCFATELNYFAMRDALRSGAGFLGTLEFFPEEGKYHWDGHRACNVGLTPMQSRHCQRVCPACAKPLTIGVMHRVEELADRLNASPPPTAAAYTRLLPLSEILGEILGVAAGSKTVSQVYHALLEQLGPELTILRDTPLEEVRRTRVPHLDVALERMRAGSVVTAPGYDGQYGVIKLFQPGELRASGTSLTLFAGAHPQPKQEPKREPDGDGDGEAAQDGRIAQPAAEQMLSETTRGTPLPTDGIAGRGDDAAGCRTGSPPRPESVSDCLLDSEQQEAVAVLEGPLMIVAGPGTGKTRTLTHRIAHLVAQRGAAPKNILAITYTVKAADEMRLRLHGLIGPAAEELHVMTFHALGLKLVQTHAAALGFAVPPQLIEPAAQRAVLTAALSITQKRATKLLDAIAHNKRARQEAPPNSATDEAHRLYQEHLRANNLVDFDDLLRLAVDLLTADAALRDHYRQQFSWVMIDEYQDIDNLQYELCQLLVPTGGNLCVIGDPDQAIYSFRGADVRYFQRFRCDHPNAREIRLSRNYRCPPAVVGAALEVIRDNPSPTPRQLVAVGGLPTNGSTAIQHSGTSAAAGTVAAQSHAAIHSGTAAATGARGIVAAAHSGTAVRGVTPASIVVHAAATDRAEAEFVVHTVEQLLGGHSFFSLDSGRVDARQAPPAAREGLCFRDFAVLARTDAQTDGLCEAFSRSGLPYHKRSHQKLCDNPHVGLLVAAMRHRLNPGLSPDAAPSDLLQCLHQAVADLITPTRNATAATPAPAAAPASAIYAAAELLRPLAAQCNNTRGDSWESFAAHMAVETEVDLLDPNADRVALLTLHAAKGLEFRVVFIVGCEDGLLPLHFGRDQNLESIQEERRLFFVGLTRAKERLFLTHAQRRLWRGSWRDTTVSPFVHAINPRWLTSSDTTAHHPKPQPATAAAARKTKQRQRRTQLALF